MIKICLNRKEVINLFRKLIKPALITFREKWLPIPISKHKVTRKEKRFVIGNTKSFIGVKNVNGRKR